MSRRCDISGVGPLFGNSVSHSHKKNRKKWCPNVQKKRFLDPLTGEWVALRVSAKLMKEIDRKGMETVLRSRGLLG